MPRLALVALLPALAHLVLARRIADRRALTAHSVDDITVAARDAGEHSLAMHNAGKRAFEAHNASEAPLLQFHIYRAGQSHWPSTTSDRQRSRNFANAGGVLRYIHNEVVGVKVVGSAKPPKCERKYDIDVIYRYKVTMRSTKEATEKYGRRHGFLPFVAMDKGKCTVPNCNEKYWLKYGYTPGCQDQNPKTSYYPDAVWYSFPGRCPGRTQDQSCNEEQESEDPGGACEPTFMGPTEPTGAWDCTYTYEPDGRIKLDDLVGIRKPYGSFRKFCEAGGIEFNGPHHNDDGVTLDFWKDYPNLEKNKGRIRAMLELFKKRYPNSPLLDDPGCGSDFVRPDYWPGE